MEARAAVEDGVLRLDGALEAEAVLVAGTPTLGALLEVGIEEMDRRVAEGYEPGGGVWHSGTSEGEATCIVCLAGALMARLGVPQGTTVERIGGEGAVAARLLALDDLREGSIESAAQALYGDGSPEHLAAAQVEARMEAAGDGVLDEARWAQRLTVWGVAERTAYRRLAQALVEAGI